MIRHAEERGCLPGGSSRWLLKGWKALRRFALFFFPTRGENYGHVIHEALAAGLPMLVSDQTPWKRLAERGIGWDLSLDHPEAFAFAIDAQNDVSAADRSAQARRSQEYAAQVSQDVEIEEQNRAMFNQALVRRDTP
jgi:glycosyltransferase involved in cell wall biosynthesis